MSMDGMDGYGSIWMIRCSLYDKECDVVFIFVYDIYSTEKERKEERKEG